VPVCQDWETIAWSLFLATLTTPLRVNAYRTFSSYCGTTLAPTSFFFRIDPDTFNYITLCSWTRLSWDAALGSIARHICPIINPPNSCISDAFFGKRSTSMNNRKNGELGKVVFWSNQKICEPSIARKPFWPAPQIHNNMTLSVLYSDIFCLTSLRERKYKATTDRAQINKIKQLRTI